MDSETPLVSIIVPVYNVEKYLVRCIDSLIKQHFTEYEIILVDDGSFDQSSDICDSYVSKYKFIKVIHKENGGLSDARNAGVKMAKADYIVFVDSDDYVEPNYISVLWNLHMKFGIEMVFSAAIKEMERKHTTHKQKLYKYREGITKCISKDNARAMILNGEVIGTSACSKLFPKEICLKYPFPKNKLMEDLHTVYYMLEEVERIAVTTKRTYHYIQRNGSILHNNYTESEAKDFIALAEVFIENAKNKVIRNAAYSRLIYIDGILAKGACDNHRNVIYSAIRNSLRPKIKYILRQSDISIKKKIRALIYSYLL